MKKQSLPQLICALFILVFIYTGISKLLSMEAFVKVLRQSVLLSRFAVVVGWLLPVSELFVAGLLVFPAMRRIGLWLSLLLMVLFTAYIGWMLLYEPRLPCSCGGIIKYMSWKQHLVFNTALIALAITGIRTIPKGVS
jgi:putative oxidoreductase